jgi:hypothetical protein
VLSDPAAHHRSLSTADHAAAALARLDDTISPQFVERGAHGGPADCESRRQPAFRGKAYTVPDQTRRHRGAHGVREALCHRAVRRLVPATQQRGCLVRSENTPRLSGLADHMPIIRYWPVGHNQFCVTFSL